MKRFLASLTIAATLSASALAQDPTARNADVDFGEPVALVIAGDDGDSHTFMVEEAKTLAQQARGMMWRESVDPDGGMIFEFDEPKIATIWMKNTAVPLDILFVRSNGKILKIEHNAQPYKLRSASSEAVVAAVVELKGGRAMELGIEPGDTVKHGFFGTAE